MVTNNIYSYRLFVLPSDYIGLGGMVVQHLETEPLRLLAHAYGTVRHSVIELFLSFVLSFF